MADLIEKKELEKKIKELMNDWKSSPTKIYVCKVILTILSDKKQLPSADTERHAHWVKSEIPCEEYTCSNCGGACWYYDSSGTVCKSKYCPNCGCKMSNVRGNKQ